MSATETITQYGKTAARGIGIVIGAVFMIFPITVIFGLEKLQTHIK
jgi:tetrahydromethanopterin S-methyltransferase subunit G